MKAVAYVRVSTGKQVDEGVSLDAQEQRIRAYCTMRGLKLACLIREEGVSASVPLQDRPAGRKLLALVAEKKAGHVIALKLDRLFRDAGDALQQTKKWDKAGIGLHLIDMGGMTLDTTSPMGRYMLTMMAGFAELERSLIAERTMAALRYKRTAGQVYSPNVPLGYRAVDGRLEKDPAEQEIIRAIRQMHDKDTPMNAIARTLNEAGITGRKGGRFYATSIKKILENPIHSPPSE